MEAPTIITPNRPKSPSYLIPCSPDPLQPDLLIPGSTSSLSDLCRPVFFSLHYHQSCVSLSSRCSLWLFPSCPCASGISVLVAKPPSTLVERPLQLSRTLYKSPLFAQNKPNPQNPRINATAYTAKLYKKKPPHRTQKNKPKQTQSPRPVGTTYDMPHTTYEPNQRFIAIPRSRRYSLICRIL